MNELNQGSPFISEDEASELLNLSQDFLKSMAVAGLIDSAKDTWGKSYYNVEEFCRKSGRSLPTASAAVLPEHSQAQQVKDYANSAQLSAKLMHTIATQFLFKMATGLLSEVNIKNLTPSDRISCDIAFKSIDRLVLLFKTSNEFTRENLGIDELLSLLDIMKEKGINHQDISDSLEG